LELVEQAPLAQQAAKKVQLGLVQQLEVVEQRRRSSWAMLQLGLEKGQLGLVAQLKLARAVKKGLAEQLKFEKDSWVLFSSWGLRMGSRVLLPS